MLDDGTEPGSLDGSFDGSNYSKPEGLLLGDSLVSTDGKVLRSDEGIELGCTDGKVLGNVLGNIDVITLGYYVWT